MIYLAILSSITVKSFPIIFFMIFAFNGNFKFKLRYVILAASVFTILISFLSYFMTLHERLSGINDVLFSIVYLSSITCLIFTFTDKSRKSFFIIIFGVFAVKTIMDGIVRTLQLYQHHNELAQDSTIYFIANSLLDLFKSMGFFIEMFAIFLSLPIVFYLIKYYFRPALQTSFELKFWNYIWVIPVSFFAVFRFIIFPSYSDTSLGPFNYYIFFLPIWVICICILYLAILKMLLQVSNTIKLQKELRVLALSMEMQQNQYKVLQKGIGEVKKLHHDKRHQILVLRSLVNDRDTGGIINALQAQIEKLDELDVVSRCENRRLNTILWFFAKSAEEIGIAILTDVNIPDDDPFDTISDLCIIYGTLLEKTLKLCRKTKAKEKRIEIKSAFINHTDVEIKMSCTPAKEGCHLDLSLVHPLIVGYGGILEMTFAKNTMSLSTVLHLNEKS